MAKKTKSLKAVEAAKARKKRRNRKKKRIAILVAEIIILILLCGVAFVMAKYDMFQTVAIDADDIMINEGVRQEGYSTYVLFGGDSREGQLEAGSHADTIIIVSLDNESKEIRMASVYRDTLLEQMDMDYHKANQGYYRGGPVEAINMLNKNLDLAIEDYATVDFKAMSDVVDLLGGIEINVTDVEAKALNKYIKETAKVAGKEAHELSGGGTYTLDGPQAVTYARIRKLEGGDYKRTERQRVVIKALFNKAKKMDIATLNSIIDTVFPQVSTSLELKELIALEPIHMDSPPFFGIDEHACDPGYEPKETGSAQIKEGSRLIIDIAGRLPQDNAIYYDISWCMNVGPDIDPEYQSIFNLVNEARTQILKIIQKALDHDTPIRGCDVDAFAQSFFRKNMKYTK